MRWNREDLAWMAALYEGEGCVQMNPLRLKFTMCDEDVLQAFADRAGFNVVGGPFAPSGLGKKPRYYWQVSGKKAYALLVAMWPWLCSRRRSLTYAAIKWHLAQSHYQKLLPDQVRDIRERLRTGDRGIGRVLATEYGISDAMVSSIKVGRTWKDVA